MVNSVLFKYIQFVLLLLTILFVPSAYPQNLPAGQEELPLDSLLNVHVSTASRYWQTINEAPASISIITSEQIDAYGYETIAEALNSLAGFYLSPRGTAINIGTRGFCRTNDDNNRIVFLLNGHVLNENVFGATSIESAYGLNFHAINRIEVMRGSASALYGNGAMFDVINIITRNDTAERNGMAELSYGTHQTRRASVYFNKSLSSSLNLFVSTVWHDNQGSRLYVPELAVPGIFDGSVDHVGRQQSSGFYGRIDYAHLTLYGMVSFQKQTTIDQYHAPTYLQESSDGRSFFGIEYQHDFSNRLFLTLSSSYDRYSYSLSNGAIVSQSDHPTGEWYTEELHTRWNITSRDVLILGLEYHNNPYANYFNKNYDTSVTDKNASYSIGSLYLENIYQINALFALTTDLRYDQYSTSAQLLSSRGGLVLSPHPAATIKLLYGNGFRQPNYYENYFAQILPQGPGETNTALDPLPTSNNNASSAVSPKASIPPPEKIQTAEIIWEQRLEDNVLSILTLYHYRLNNLVQSLSGLSSSGNNVTAIKTTGIEFSSQYSTQQGISGYCNYSYQHSQDDPGNQQSTDSPEHLFKAGLSWHTPWCGMISSEFIYETQRLTEARTWTSTYAIWNILVAVHLWSDCLSFEFAVQNVLNRRYTLPGGYVSQQYAAEYGERNFSLRCQYGF